MTVAVNLDLDQELLNHLVVPDSAWRLREVSDEVIEVPRIAEAFAWSMAYMRDGGIVAGERVMRDEFPDLEFSEHETSIGDLIQRLQRRYARNQARKIWRDTTKLVNADPLSLGAEMVRQGRELIKIIAPRSEAYGPQDVDRIIRYYHQQVLEGRGPSFGFKELDEHFYGQRGLSFMCGAPKSMKSWFTIKTTLENIFEGAVPYLYSLELPAAETEMRLLCMATGVPFWKYIKHAMTNDDLMKIEQCKDLLGDFVIEKPPRGHRSVDYLVDRARNYGADLILVDQLQYVEHRGKTLGERNDPGEYWGAINSFHDHTDDGPIWIVHQFNRSIMGSDGMPDFQQIKGSSAIEECGSLCLGLWASGEMKKSSLVRLGTLITRHLTPMTWEARINFKTAQDIEIVGTVDDA